MFKMARTHRSKLVKEVEMGLKSYVENGKDTVV